jgi:hypothetical protein
MKTTLMAMALLLLAFAAGAQEQAFTNRATDLKSAPDGATVRPLAEGTAVKVLQRQGGWTRVDAGGQAGWVRVFHLRFPVTAETSSSSGNALSGLGSALGFGRQRAQSTTIATTGIRGLSTEELKNAAPDGEALRRMQSYRSDPGGAERFAREGKLNATKVDYQEGRR